MSLVSQVEGPYTQLARRIRAVVENKQMSVKILNKFTNLKF